MKINSYTANCNCTNFECGVSFTRRDQLQDHLNWHSELCTSSRKSNDTSLYPFAMLYQQNKSKPHP